MGQTSPSFSPLTLALLDHLINTHFSQNIDVPYVAILPDDVRAHLVQLHEQLHEQLHNFNSQTTNSLPNSLVSFSENSLSQS
jgi:hypothetical protein